MSKLHELLAVENNLSGQEQKCRTDLANTFEKKQSHFAEKIITTNFLEEGKAPNVEVQFSIQTSVKKELDWITDKISSLWDVSLQIADANTRAKSNIELNGTVIVENIPATALLELEKRLVDVKGLIEKIPTLDPTKGFSPDQQKGHDVFKAREIKKPKTRKDKRVLVRYQHTEQHPAQTEVYDADIVIGEIQEQEWSTLITTVEKADMLDRVETLIRAVKTARSKANEVEVNKNLKIGKRLLSFIFKGE